MVKGYSQEEIIIFNSKDNVGLIKKEVKKGNKIIINSPKYLNTIEVKDTIPRRFKIALNNISVNENIIKMGEVIGKAKAKIEKGEMVHVHNIEGIRAGGNR